MIYAKLTLHSAFVLRNAFTWKVAPSHLVVSVKVNCPTCETIPEMSPDWDLTIDISRIWEAPMYVQGRGSWASTSTIAIWPCFTKPDQTRWSVPSTFSIWHTICDSSKAACNGRSMSPVSVDFERFHYVKAQICNALACKAERVNNRPILTSSSNIIPDYVNATLFPTEVAC